MQPICATGPHSSVLESGCICYPSGDQISNILIVHVREQLVELPPIQPVHLPTSTPLIQVWCRDWRYASSRPSDIAFLEGSQLVWWMGRCRWLEELARCRECYLRPWWNVALGGVGERRSLPLVSSGPQLPGFGVDCDLSLKWEGGTS